MAWLRSTPVHPEVERIVRQQYPYGVAEVILEYANNPPILVMHNGRWCSLEQPCDFCRGFGALSRKKRSR